MNTEQRLALDDINNILRWSLIHTKGTDIVGVQIFVGHTEYIRAFVRGHALPQLAEKIATRISMTKWDAPVSTVVKTGDGISHILRTYKGTP